ncbi:glycoside hydrolase family 24 protein [Macrolepiota fuliginosa MF-IS2]|uniref:Glycoside hydrolase family 24 protein n=1 Tax=Macrolepiota fuliginosa MF-IS2 TaxID=1400762 RepID=A0A9P5XF69_9AGAR|nr:glycoside hydrolase family 24 protein [Macrolepiota fuliginosa MF-IS2]
MFKTLSLLLITSGFTQAAIDDACSVGSTPGVCIYSTDCASAGGTYAAGYCPDDSADVTCCYKTSCGSGGSCSFTSTCSTGNTATGLCPGPSTFTCCLPASTCSPKAVNSATVSLIKQLEGFVASPAPDPIGLPTVGYGHLCQTSGCAEVPYAFPLTTTTASQLLLSDLKEFEQCISDYVDDNVPLNENQYGALVSWSFNVGCPNAQSSTLIARLNAGDDPNTVAAEELPKWVYAGGEVLPGLVTRRNEEVSLFQTYLSVIGQPPC